MEISNHLNENLRFLRKKMNLSQEEFANKVGLNRGNIASYEKGTAEPKICNLLKIAKACGVSLSELTAIKICEEKFKVIKGSNNINKEELLEGLNCQMQRLGDMENIVNSINNCRDYAIKQLDKESKEFQTLENYYEQLFTLTMDILKDQKAYLQQFDR